MSNDSRVQSGVPTGGQFATRTRESDAIVLSDAYDRLMEGDGTTEFVSDPTVFAALSPEGQCEIRGHTFPAGDPDPECGRCGAFANDLEDDDEDEDEDYYSPVVAGGALIASTRHIEI